MGLLSVFDSAMIRAPRDGLSLPVAKERMVGPKSILSRSLIVVMIASAGSAACGSDDDDAGSNCGSVGGECAGGQVCESTAGGGRGCFAPLEVSGRVFDVLSDAGLVGATVVALDANGAALSTVVVTGAGGAYRLPLSVARRAGGSPDDVSIKLRVAADSYQPFPFAPREALPVELGSAASVESRLVVQNAATDVGLLPLGDKAHGEHTVSGALGAPGAGALVVAELNQEAVATAVAGVGGGWTLFNVPDGDVTIGAYRGGYWARPTLVNVSRDLADVELDGGSGGFGAVRGSVNFVNPGAGDATSVVLVVESTFDENLARGESPSGLRAGGITSSDGSFVISSVPPGRYAVLAAFENDSLVRDPDQTIGGTDVAHIDVPEAGGEVPLDASFKITGALAVITPGANGIEEVASLTPTLEWEQDSSEDGYELRVYDALGELIVEEDDLPSVNGSGNVIYTLDRVPLEPGMIYQFRARSFREKNAKRTYISATEDLKGVFQYATQ